LRETEVFFVVKGKDYVAGAGNQDYKSQAG